MGAPPAGARGASNCHTTTNPFSRVRARCAATARRHPSCLVFVAGTSPASKRRAPGPHQACAHRAVCEAWCCNAPQPQPRTLGAFEASPSLGEFTPETATLLGCSTRDGASSRTVAQPGQGGGGGVGFQTDVRAWPALTREKRPRGMRRVPCAPRPSELHAHTFALRGKREPKPPVCIAVGSDSKKAIECAEEGASIFAPAVPTPSSLGGASSCVFLSRFSALARVFERPSNCTPPP